MVDISDADLKVKEEEYPSQWRLIWRRLLRHRLAVAGAVIVLLMYFLAATAEFIGPYDPVLRKPADVNKAPQGVHFFDEDGSFVGYPFVYGTKQVLDMKTFARTHVVDPSRKYRVLLFPRGYSYRLFGLIPTDRHLFGVEAPGTLYLFGTDALGRDLLSRTLIAARISLSIGLVGVALSMLIGVTLGGISGYFGGRIDFVIQRIGEVIHSIPTIPLWLGLSAALPQHWSPLQIYFGIVVILSSIGWVGVARVVRGKFLQLREMEYIVAAKVTGTSDARIIRRHMVPAFLSYIIVRITLAIPFMILGETSLSFLGLGLRPPAISWGTLLQDAQNVRTVILYPWLLIPGVFVFVTIVALNALGDGLRDAADPYK